ncbi:MAG: pantoate--beta-alanine ligase [Bacillota bacterium]|nr:pantoate--beta-alanine ligase [Bacillota bacterium]
MRVAVTVEEIRNQVKEWKREGLSVGLVPTMGALHEGHASLVDASVKSCDRTVTSIFVNPKQFGKSEDLDSYPRTFDEDCRILEERGCDMVFAPTVDVMYPDGFGAEIQITTDMVNQLCGASRPGHFKGVCTVVGKLFNIVAPDKAFFGEKDAQQLAVIRKMVKDLNFDVEVVGCPTIREADGLAKSSRNVYMNEEERNAAGILYQSMLKAQELIKNGERSAETIAEQMKALIATEGMAQIDYVRIVDGLTLLPTDEVKAGDLVALAVCFGNTRLIDNFTVSF